VEPTETASLLLMDFDMVNPVEMSFGWMHFYEDLLLNPIYQGFFVCLSDEFIGDIYVFELLLEFFCELLLHFLQHFVFL